jgi:hypothetical protein
VNTISLFLSFLNPTLLITDSIYFAAAAASHLTLEVLSILVDSCSDDERDDKDNERTQRPSTEPFFTIDIRNTKILAPLLCCATI